MLNVHRHASLQLIQKWFSRGGVLWMLILKQISILLWWTKYPHHWKSVQENKCVSVTTNYFSNNVLLSLMPLTLLDCNILTRFQPSMALEILLDDTNTFLSYLFYFSFKSHTHTDYSAFSVFVDITIFSSSKDNGC